MRPTKIFPYLIVAVLAVAGIATVLASSGGGLRGPGADSTTPQGSANVAANEAIESEADGLVLGSAESPNAEESVAVADGDGACGARCSARSGNAPLGQVGPTQTPTPSATVSPTGGTGPTPTPTPTPVTSGSPAPSPTNVAGASPTPTPVPTGSPAPSPTNGASPSPTVTPTPPASPAPSLGPSPSPTNGASPSPTPDEIEIEGDAIECPSGKDTRFKLEIEHDEFEVTGLLVSLDDDMVVVTGPDGDVAASLSDDAEIEGDPQPGDAVEVEGEALADGAFMADEIEPACEDDDHDDDHDDDDDDEKDDHDDDDHHDDHHDDGKDDHDDDDE